MSHSGQQAGDAIKKGVHSIHGFGEVIRGNINQFADSATFTDRDHKNRDVTNHGIEEMESGKSHSTHSGATTTHTTTDQTNKAI